MIRSTTLCRVLALGGLILSLSAAGCGGEEKSETPPAPAATTPAQPPAPEPAAKPPVVTRAQEREQASATPGVPLRETLRGEVDVPGEYPDDAPVYPAATASQAETFQGSVNVTFVTGDSADQVVAFLESDLAAKGWGDVRTESMEGTFITYGTKSSRKLSAMTTRFEDDDPITMLMIAVDE
jgi:hypothetical protein